MTARTITHVESHARMMELCTPCRNIIDFLLYSGSVIATRGDGMEVQLQSRILDPSSLVALECMVLHLNFAHGYSIGRFLIHRHRVQVLQTAPDT